MREIERVRGIEREKQKRDKRTEKRYILTERRDKTKTKGRRGITNRNKMREKRGWKRERKKEGETHKQREKYREKEG